MPSVTLSKDLSAHSNLVVDVTVNQQTINWLYHRFRISSLFLECVVHLTWGARPGNARWVKRGKDGNVVQLGKQMSKPVVAF